MISAMRLVLSGSALLAIYVDPMVPTGLVDVIYTVLTLYTLYSAVLYVLSLKRSQLIPVRVTHWVDVAWYTLLIALGGGTSSVFFFFFFFAILLAAFRWGFAEGLCVTVVSTALYTTVGFLTAPSGQEFELARALLRPIYLLVLGYMIAYWGGAEATLKRRLSFLKEAGRLSNLRLGAGHTVGSMLERVRRFYDADRCILITKDPELPQYLLRQAYRDQPTRAVFAEPLSAGEASALLTLPERCSIVAQPDRGRRSLNGSFRVIYHVTYLGLGEGDHGVDVTTAAEELTRRFDGASFATVPMLVTDKDKGMWEFVGRLFVTNSLRGLNKSDLEFLIQVSEHITPVVEELERLLRPALDVAAQERQRISRDIHDTIIQPFFGIKTRAETLHRKVSADENLPEHLKDSVEDLVRHTNEELKELRAYVKGLREGGAVVGSSFVTALRREAEVRGQLYGLDVHVEVEANIHITDRLATEVLHMVLEGLSNARRHNSDARRAVITVSSTGNSLVLKITNDGAGKLAKRRFIPRSITERAASLGGSVQVNSRNDLTEVIVEVPL